MRELPHWFFALVLVYVVASGYDPLWILEPPPTQQLLEQQDPTLHLTLAPAPSSVPAVLVESLGEHLSAQVFSDSCGIETAAPETLEGEAPFDPSC